MNEIQSAIETVLEVKTTVPAQYVQTQMFLTQAVAALEQAKANYPVLPKAR